MRQRHTRRPPQALLPASVFATPDPDEQVWAHVKRQISRKLLQSIDDMKKLALGVLRRRIQKLPELVKSFFRQPECQYAAN
jgi:hypothetical protein